MTGKRKSCRPDLWFNEGGKNKAPSRRENAQKSIRILGPRKTRMSHYMRQMRVEVTSGETVMTANATSRKIPQLLHAPPMAGAARSRRKRKLSRPDAMTTGIREKGKHICYNSRRRRNYKSDLRLKSKQSGDWRERKEARD